MSLYDGPRPPRHKRDPVDAERCRQRIGELEAERVRVSCAPWCAAQAKERAAAEIERLAKRGQPSVLPLIQTPDKGIGWGERPISDLMVAGRLMTIEGDPSPGPLLVWLLKDELIGRIEAAIDEAADDEQALTVKERTEQLQRIAQDKLAVERQEEFFIEQANRGSAHVLRRPDADARALLGLAGDAPAP
jgi:hypothetical protein